MYFIIIAILIPLIILLLKTFKYRKTNSDDIDHIPWDISETSKKKFIEAIRIRTVSHSDYSKNDLDEFRKIRSYIEKNYPVLCRELELSSLNEYSHIIKWPGKNSNLNPVLLISHFDVVPVVEKDWSVSPFDGIEKDGFIWGRGTLDTKNTLTAILESAETLLTEGFVPERTIYMAFGGDEETQGNKGAGEICGYFEKENIEFDWLLDEGGIVAEDSLSMVKQPLALIGTSEKGYVNIRVTSEAKAGHSSMPSAHSAAGFVAAAVTEVEKHPFPAKITPTISAFLYGITPYVSFPTALVLANHRIFAPLIKKLLLQSDTSAALLRTTQAVTILRSGHKENILPSEGEAIINIRILPGESVDSVLKRLKTLLRKMPVKVEIADYNDSNDPIRESSIDCSGYKLVKSVIRSIFPEAVTVPYMMTGATDSKHYKTICRDIYRFAPMSLNQKELGLIHGTDERISLENYGKSLAFYKTLIKKI